MLEILRKRKRRLEWEGALGDVHQPLHCANDDDRGRNEKLIRFEGRENESSRLVGSTNLQGKQREFQDRLEQNFGPYYSRRCKGHPSGMAECRAI